MNLGIVFFVYVCVTSLKTVCPQGIILSQQGIMLRVPFSNISALSTKRYPGELKSDGHVTISHRILAQLSEYTLLQMREGDGVGRPPPIIFEGRNLP